MNEVGHAPLASLTSPKTNELLAMSAGDLQAWLAAHISRGGKSGQTKTLLHYMHRLGVLKPFLMSQLNARLRTSLSAVLPSIALPATTAEEVVDSEDGTHKYLVRLNDNHTVESVLIPTAKRLSLCVSSQVACPLNCDFCATGQQTFKRSLRAAEIVAQLWLAQHVWSKSIHTKIPVTNVVFMGMGEPMLNLSEVIQAITVMLSAQAYALAKSRITVSTVGHVEGIRRLADSGLDVNLAVSIHAPNDTLRNRLIPINRKYPLATLISACRYYQSIGSRRDKIMVQYTLIDQVNDSVACAKQLADLLGDLPVKINLLPFNPIPNSRYRRPSPETMKRFHQVLSERRLISMFRFSRGLGVQAACGQLASA